MGKNCYEQISGFELLAVQNRFDLIDTIEHSGHIFSIYKISVMKLSEIQNNDISEHLRGRLYNNDYLIIRDQNDCAIYGFPTTQNEAVEFAKSYSDMLDAQLDLCNKLNQEI